MLPFGNSGATVCMTSALIPSRRAGSLSSSTVFLPRSDRIRVLDLGLVLLEDVVGAGVLELQGGGDHEEAATIRPGGVEHQALDLVE